MCRLAPLYDTVPTALWPALRTNAALAVNDVQTMSSITIADITADARRWAHRAERTAVEVVEQLLEETTTIDLAPLQSLVRANGERLLAGR